MWAGLCLAAAAAGAARAQTIKPLDVEPDGNGVDLLSGRISTPLPVLAIPAAPNLRFQRLQDLLPYLNGRLQPGLDAPATYDINTGGSTSENFTCDNDGCTSRKRNGSALDANPGAHEFTYYEGGTGRAIRFDLHNGPQGPLTPGMSAFGFYASTVRYPSGETLAFAYDEATTSAGHVVRRPISVTSTIGYTLSLIYQGNVYDQPGWSVLAIGDDPCQRQFDAAGAAHLCGRQRHRSRRADLDLRAVRQFADRAEPDQRDRAAPARRGGRYAPGRGGGAQLSRPDSQQLGDPGHARRS